MAVHLMTGFNRPASSEARKNSVVTTHSTLAESRPQGGQAHVPRCGRPPYARRRKSTAAHRFRIETAAPGLDWLNKGIFVSVGARQAAGVTYETYLVE
jgi:hypothetical protein